ncbi:MAG: AI-2E family transporter [Halobacteria archaeon]|nr:AI-2E family transporter [Halobacteria archaeon]
MTDVTLDTEILRRISLAIIGLLLIALVGYVLIKFIASIVFAVFLYYSSRPIYKRVTKLGLPRRLCAGVTMALFALPFVILLAYTVSLVITEAQLFLNKYPVEISSLNRLVEQASGVELPELTAEGIGDYLGGQNFDKILGLVVTHGSSLLDFLVTFLIRFAIMVIIVYYLLVDGKRLKEWVLATFDQNDVLRSYFNRVDAELSKIMFGNILNALLTGVIAIIVYHSYNFVAPPVAEIPFPSLVGALTGIGSLIPIVGMKIVYYPVGAIMAGLVLLSGETTALVYVAGFFVVSFVIVDLVPDIVLRPFVSGKNTHMGLLMFSYIMGPLVFGFYGLFLLPIILVLATNFCRMILPFVLTGETGQRKLSDYVEGGD